MDTKASRSLPDSLEGCCMAFTPQSSSMRGGEVIFTTYSEDYPLPDGGNFYFVFDGKDQRHVTTAQPINSHTLRAVIPGHGSAEKVVLSVYCVNDGKLGCLSSHRFLYEVETEQIIAQLLADSVSKPGLLECLVPLASFSNGISKEFRETLDVRITNAFECLDLSPAWTLGCKNGDKSGQETLLHFATRLGFTQLTSFLLDQPGANSALNMHDRDGKSPEEIARDRGMRLLVEALKRGPGVCEPKKSKDTSKPQWKKNEIGTTTISSYKNRDQNSLEKDIDMLGEINSLVREEIEVKKRMPKFKHNWPLKRKGKDISTVAGDESTSDEEIKHLMIRGDHQPKKHAYSSQMNSVTPGNRGNPSSNRQLLEQNLRRLRDINEEIQRLRLVNAQRNSREGKGGGERRQLSRRLSCPAFRGQEMLQPHIQAGRVAVQDAKLVQNGNIGLDERSTLMGRKGGTARREKEDDVKSSSNSGDVASNRQKKDIRNLLSKDNTRPHSWAEEDSPPPEDRTGLNRRVSSSLSDLRQGAKGAGEEEADDTSRHAGEASQVKANGRLESSEKNNLADIIDSVKRQRQDNQTVVKSPTSSVTSLNDVDVDLGEREEAPDLHLKSNLTSKSLSYGCLTDIGRAQVKPRPKSVRGLIEPRSPTLEPEKRGENSQMSLLDFLNNDDISLEVEEGLSPPTTCSPEARDAANKAQNRLSLEEFLQHENDSPDDSEETATGSRTENGDKNTKGLRRLSMLFGGSSNKPKPPKRDLTSSKLDSKSKIRSSLRRGEKGVSKVGLGSLSNLSTKDSELKDREKERKEQLRDPSARTALARRASGAVNNKAEPSLPSPAMLTKMGSQNTSKTSLPVSRSHSNRSTSPLPFRSNHYKSDHHRSMDHLFFSHISPKNRKRLSAPPVSSEQDDEKSGVSPEDSANEEDDEEVFDLEDLNDSDLEIKAEPEAWSVTVEKKLTKKMTAKDIKRQDVIHELIWTESHFVRTLKIMQKIFYRGMVNRVGIPKETVDQVFPRLDDLMDINSTFLNKLKATQGKDSVVHCIGGALVEQFEGRSGERIKEVYGEFCSHHLEAVELYNKLKKNDKKFADFIKKCNVNKLCRRLYIDDAITLVSQRLTKYPLLIDAILKTTKENMKPEYDMLKKSIRSVKTILHGVDDTIKEYEKEKKLSDIKLKLDLKVTITYKWGEKLKKVKNIDFASNTSKLIHDGMLCWKTARGKLAETNVLILEDMLVFLQEKDQKYTLLSFDQKAPVIRLRNLMVREVATDVKAIFLVSTIKDAPEMYEIVCESAKQKRMWMEVIRDAVAKSPEDDNTGDIIVTAEDEKRKVILKRACVLIEQAENMEEVEDKGKNLSDMQDMLTQIEGLGKTKMEQDKRQELTKCKENLLSALQQLQSTLTEDDQSQSSATADDGSSLWLPNGPKRAETFSGFDTKNKLDLAKDQSVLRASSMKTERVVKSYNRQLPGVAGAPVPGSTSPSGGSPKMKHKRRGSGSGGWSFLKGKEEKAGSAGDLASSSSSSASTTPTASPAPGQEDSSELDGNKGTAVHGASAAGSPKSKPARANHTSNSPTQHRRNGKGKPDLESKRKQSGHGTDSKGSSSPDVIYF